MRKNGVERQFAIAERSSRKWPDHKFKEAAKIFRETATLTDSEKTMKLTPPLSQLDYIECDLAEATNFSIKDKMFSIQGETATKKAGSISLRFEFDRWVDFDEKDFDILEIKCLKVKKKEPVKFTGEVIFIETHTVDNHGHASPRGFYAVQIPNGLPFREGDKVDCSSLADEWNNPVTYEILYNNRRGDPNLDPYWYIVDSNGFNHPGKFDSKEDAQKTIDIWNY
jgi:hypothetical protein